MENKELSLFEQEKLDEDNLLFSFEKINISYKNKDRNEFFNELSNLDNDNLSTFTNSSNNRFIHSNKEDKRSLSFDIIENNRYDQALISKINTASNNYNSNINIEANCSTNADSLYSLISQNLEISQSTLKLMVIGDNHVGKTLFINKIIKGNNVDYNYNPTKRYILL